MFHTNFVEQKAAANVPKTKVSTNIHIEHENGCKRQIKAF